jgi:aryl-alcohol dehydrogenase-like predicted oxidoreductase
LSEVGARHKVVIATNVGLNWRDGKVFRDASRARVIEEVEDSLGRLRTDVIDAYEVHWQKSTGVHSRGKHASPSGQRTGSAESDRLSEIPGYRQGGPDG